MNKSIQKSIILFILLFLLTSCGNSRKKNYSTIQPVSNSISDPLKPTFNVYMENSGSMDGYVKGTTQFEQALYNYLTNIKISVEPTITDSLNLYYINREIIPRGSSLEDFIEKLEPANFRAAGGNRGESDIADVLANVLKNTEGDVVSIMVTDGIFSPGRGRDASEYLINQQIGIKRIFADYIKENKDGAVILYQLSSRFNGIYYNLIDSRIPIDENRLFYVWVIGSKDYLKTLKDKVKDEYLKERSAENWLNVFTAMNGIQEIKYALHTSIGKWEKSKSKTSTTITKLKKDKRSGEVKFAINVDFSNLLLDDSYLLNLENYENNSKYDIEVKSSKNSNYTHTLYFTSDKVSVGQVKVKLKAKKPDWVNETNDDDGTGAAKDKTYGIKYQVDGVFEAFTINSGEYYAEINIEIK